MQTYTLKIENIIKETSDTVTVCFKQPGLKKIKYAAGQYLTLIFRINGRRYIRPYSFSSAPGIDTTLNVTVKRVSGGVVSNHIADRLQIGDLVEVIHPMGDFIINHPLQEDASSKCLVLWGSGSGITPLMSLIKFALLTLNFRHVTLVYGNRNFETTIFSKQIDQLQQQYPKKFAAWHFHTKAHVDNSNPYVIQGRIDPEKVIEVINNEYDLKSTVHYICGPVGLKSSVKGQLEKIGINGADIYSEDFEVIRDPEALKDIQTQIVTINNNGQILTFEVPKGKSILEAGLDASLELTYSCQTGSCLLCKAQLLQGEIKTVGIEKLPDELHTDECLLCCGFPLNDNVEILIPN